MGRLIDADALLKKFRYGEADTDNDKAWISTISTIRRIIKEQPTAYDVDKVVEELEEETECPNCSMYCADAHICGFDEMRKQAIDIARKGGVE